ncbi:MAG: type VII toxin-antitoxin system HepT family RNase toxin [Candidatus Odinarchaeia archaeon]
MDIEERIILKVRELKRYVDFLKKYKDISREKLEEDYVLRSAIERNFHLALECMLDIGELIISAEGFRKPESYREVIEILGEEGVISREFAEKLAPAAGFRNILVHKYSEVDLDLLHEYLSEKLGDFDVFTEFIVKYVKEKKGC